MDAPLVAPGYDKTSLPVRESFSPIHHRQHHSMEDKGGRTGLDHYLLCMSGLGQIHYDKELCGCVCERGERGGEGEKREIVCVWYIVVTISIQAQTTKAQTTKECTLGRKPLSLSGYLIIRKMLTVLYYIPNH